MLDSTSEDGASCCIVHLCLTNHHEEVTSPDKCSSVITCCEAAVAIISTSLRHHQRHVTSVPKSYENCNKSHMKSATFPTHVTQQRPCQKSQNVSCSVTLYCRLQQYLQEVVLSSSDGQVVNAKKHPSRVCRVQPQKQLGILQGCAVQAPPAQVLHIYIQCVYKVSTRKT